MSQHDFDIANQSASSARADINNALKALASQSSGATAPSTTYANMPWYDTGTNTLKIRSEADDAWISMGYLDQSSNVFKLFDNTQIVNSGGTQTGLLGDQAESVWEAGTGTTESLVSPAKVKAAVEALVPEQDDPIGVGQTFSSFSNGANTSYQNSTGRPIQVTYRTVVSTGGGSGSANAYFEVSSNNSSWETVGWITGGPNDNHGGTVTSIIPNGYYYRGSKAGTMVRLS